MSIENCILELAAAIRELAASNLATAGGAPLTIDEGTALLAEAHPPRDTIEQDVAKVETDAKAAQQKAMDKVSTGKAEIAAALEKAKAEKAAADAQAKADADNAAAGDPLDESPVVELSYENDVKKKLVAVGKNKQEMVDLLKTFGVGAGMTYDKADKLPKEKYAEVVAACDKILAARG